MPPLASSPPRTDPNFSIESKRWLSPNAVKSSSSSGGRLARRVASTSTTLPILQTPSTIPFQSLSATSATKKYICKICPPARRVQSGLVRPSRLVSSPSRSDQDFSFVSKQSSLPNTVKSPSSSGGRPSFCRVWFCLSCPPTFDEPIMGGQTQSWRSQLLKFSTWASMLCVLDCTILPLLTVIFPLLGCMDHLLNESWLDEVGHTVALCVVLPIGALATTTNYCLAHRRLWVAGVGWMGMIAIAAANGGCQGILCILGDTPIGSAIESFLHIVHHGLAHRVANLTGCALLMCSNYLSKTVPQI